MFSLALVPNPRDKRSRSIMMTKKGREFQSTVIPAIERAELEAFASLSEQDQQIMTGLWEKYTDMCISKLNNAMQVQNGGKDR